MDDQHADAQARQSAGDVTNPDLREEQSCKPIKPEASRPLTPEEQMALYEKELKENDWGHQPC